MVVLDPSLLYRVVVVVTSRSDGTYLPAAIRGGAEMIEDPITAEAAIALKSFI